MTGIPLRSVSGSKAAEAKGVRCNFMTLAPAQGVEKCKLNIQTSFEIVLVLLLIFLVIALAPFWLPIILIWLIWCLIRSL